MYSTAKAPTDFCRLVRRKKNQRQASTAAIPIILPKPFTHKLLQFNCIRWTHACLQQSARNEYESIFWERWWSLQTSVAYVWSVQLYLVIQLMSTVVGLLLIKLAIFFCCDVRNTLFIYSCCMHDTFWMQWQTVQCRQLLTAFVLIRYSWSS